MKRLNPIHILFISIFILGCQNSETTKEADIQVSTPVTVTGIEHSAISESIRMNAVSAFQKKNLVKSNINGYIEKSYINIGDYVQAGKLLYSLKTKEAAALSNYKQNDSSLLFNGESEIRARASGIVTELTKLTGDYVADGDQLCVIADQSSFVFLLNVPFEQNKYVKTGTICNLVLPDSSIIRGTISSKLSSVDAVSQTQSYVVNPQINKLLPENLLASVQIIKSTKQSAQVIDKNCILTDETMENFWVMKLINDTTAIKVDIVKGLSTESKIEIISPQFGKQDRIIRSGGYGLPDTVFVNIIDK